MSALAGNRSTQRRSNVVGDLPVKASTHIYRGSLVAVLSSTGHAQPGADTASTQFMGVAMQDVNNTGTAGSKRVQVWRDGVFRFASASTLTEAKIGDNVFLYDDQTVGLSAQVSNAIYCGVIAPPFISATECWVDIVPAIEQADVATHIADTSAAHAAGSISFADSGNKTAADEVDGALDEIYVHLTTAQGIIPIPMPHITAAGVALAAFADGASATPGFCVTAKGMGIRWNNNATHTAVATKVVVPPDADVTANMTLNILAAKTGATAGDLPTFTVQAFNNEVAALYDADADFGGTTDAMTNPTAKTVQRKTLTLALANLSAYPTAMEVTIQPTNGMLGTDDVIMLAAWIVYTKKILSS